MAFAVPLSAAIWTTYSPGAENRAVVTGAFGSANVTVPGPDTLLQATAGAGPGGGDGGGAACGGGPPGRRWLRGCGPTPVHPFRYVLPWRITTRSGPAAALKAAGGSACADSTPSPPNASSTSGEATTTAVAFPAVFSSSRLVREFFSVWLMNHLVLRVLEGETPERPAWLAPNQNLTSTRLPEYWTVRVVPPGINSTVNVRRAVRFVAPPGGPGSMVSRALRSFHVMRVQAPFPAR